jgi:hypothetical protein
MRKDDCEFCANKAQEAEIKKQEGPFGVNGESIFKERGVSAGGKIIGVEI